MVGPPFVILSQHTGEDPRTLGQKEPKTVSVRVTLQRHHDPVRIVVETEDGRDGVGALHWRRIDNGSLDEARAAYETLERLTAEYYERFTAAEERAVRAEKAAADARAQPRVVPTMAVPRLAISDPRIKAKEKLDDLLGLANHADTPTDEARNAAFAAVRLMHQHKIMPR